MPTYLYCLLRARSDPPPPHLAGHAAQPVRVLEAGGLRAWVSDIPERERLDRTPASARVHDAVCSAALASGETPLPARFGQRFDSDESCITEVRKRERDLLGVLERVADCVEMTVHIAVEGAVAPSRDAAAGVAEEGERDGAGASSAGPGRRHLEGLRRALNAERNVQRRAGAAADRLRSRAAVMLRAEKIRVESADEIIVAHLVPRTALEEYRSALQEAGAEVGGSLRWSGPYVPYSFTE